MEDKNKFNDWTNEEIAEFIRKTEGWDNADLISIAMDEIGQRAWKAWDEMGKEEQVKYFQIDEDDTETSLYGRRPLVTPSDDYGRRITKDIQDILGIDLGEK